ncbi:MAG: DNA replication and repair protein RecF [Acetobacteraceae bacterium]|nr:DNA replication and repair protein RecF [Acetobacteraceae bacterium]
MRLATLGWEGFRNLADGRVQFGPGRNVLVGPNGAGKTNLLEAICVLARGGSPRTARDQELVQWGRASFALAGRAEGERCFHLAAEYRGGRRFLLDGAEARPEEISPLLPVVLFHPADILLVQGGPVRRRRYLDRFLFQVRPDYRRWWDQYRRALEQRTAALQAPAGAADAALEPWECQLAEAGGRIIARRSEAALVLAEAASAILSHLGLRGAAMLYRPAAPGLAPVEGRIGEKEAAAVLAQGLARSRGVDRARGATQVGPHRDDLLLILEGREARRFASQGQQRSLALGLRLAELRCVEAGAGVAPLLLLDDVASELDRDRRRKLAELTPPHLQVFVTSAEGALEAGLEGARGADVRLFRVHDGEVRPG